ncbi:adhesion G protein-coupled receptor L3-like [Saccostrea cucullata]|uniref:adhesion G protein-coupled receptor L3-like n=1 Tax=Saccostrea cuccullata TaxID=36930 RepID=UPI002ED0868D
MADNDYLLPSDSIHELLLDSGPSFFPIGIVVVLGALVLSNNRVQDARLSNLQDQLLECEQRANTPEQRTVIMCGADDGEIRCENSKTLTIVSANYGRTEPTAQVCPSTSASMDDTNCRLDVLNKLSQDCNGKTRCAVPTRLNDFGGSSVNPCPSTYKYTEVQYTCS